MSAVVIELRAKVGSQVKAGDPIAILSVRAGRFIPEVSANLRMQAMKMETAVTSPVAGKVERVAVAEGDSLASGDLIAVISAA
jgi:pyruvate carboxylase